VNKFQSTKVDGNLTNYTHIYPECLLCALNVPNEPISFILQMQSSFAV